MTGEIRVLTPAPAADEQAPPAPGEVHYHFPVHVVVLGEPDPVGTAQRDADLRADVYDELARALG